MSSNSSYPANPLQTNSPSANPSFTPDAPVTSHELIPGNLSTKNPMAWTIEEVQSFLSHNREKYCLNDADIDLIRNNELGGIAFLDLTREDLRGDPFNMSFGRVKTFEHLIRALKEASKEPYQHSLEMPTSALNTISSDIKHLIQHELNTIRSDVRHLIKLAEDENLEIVFSRVTIAQYDRFLAAIGIRVTKAKPEIVPVSRDVVEFEWDPEKSEVSHSTQCLTWLSDHFQLPEGFQLYYASAETDLLDTTLPATKMMTLKGTTDVVIADVDYIKLFDVRGGIRVVIEMKKQVRKKDHMQATLQLIAANCHSNYPVMTLLTDLKDTWHCYWIDVDGIKECWFEPLQAIAFVESHLIGENEGKLGTCTMREYFAARASHEEQANISPRASHEEQVNIFGERVGEVGGESKRRRVIPKVDIMDLLPTPAVGDMRDVFDVMLPKEIAVWKTKYALDCFTQKYPGTQEYPSMYL